MPTISFRWYYEEDAKRWEKAEQKGRAGKQALALLNSWRKLKAKHPDMISMECSGGRCGVGKVSEAAPPEVITPAGRAALGVEPAAPATLDDGRMKLALMPPTLASQRPRQYAVGDAVILPGLFGEVKHTITRTTDKGDRYYIAKGGDEHPYPLYADALAPYVGSELWWVTEGRAMLAAAQQRIAALEAENAALNQQRDGHDEQFLAMREALSAAGVDHIGLSVADAIAVLAAERDAALKALEPFAKAVRNDAFSRLFTCTFEKGYYWTIDLESGRHLHTDDLDRAKTVYDTLFAKPDTAQDTQS